MKVHLVDGTYELFRAFFGAPSSLGRDGNEVGATRALGRSMLYLLGDSEVSYVAVAFDHVIESFRNDLFDGYKTGAGIEATLLSQFDLAERMTRALGLVTWSMVEFEADDAIAAFAARAADDARVEQVVICSPDKDMAQCVQGERVICWDRMRNKRMNEAGVVEKFGIFPASIPDWLALVGDTADGIPGIERWGAKSAAAVLHHYQHLEAIPDLASQWTVNIRGALALATSLAAARPEATLYKHLATLRRDVPLTEQLDDLAWSGPNIDELTALASELGDDRIVQLAEERAAKNLHAKVVS
ncbi:MAG TPA: 5'-3' exonuclease H3TH domain-containing protein [Polyangiales bacterium]